MKQLRKVSVILVALVLFTGASSVLVGCKHSAETSATTENKHHPAEEIVWKNDDESWGEEYIYFEPLSETAGKYYFCYKKNSSYWNKTHTSIFDYTRNGDSFKIDGTPIASNLYKSYKSNTWRSKNRCSKFCRALLAKIKPLF